MSRRKIFTATLLLPCFPFPLSSVLLLCAIVIPFQQVSQLFFCLFNPLEHFFDWYFMSSLGVIDSIYRLSWKSFTFGVEIFRLRFVLLTSCSGSQYFEREICDGWSIVNGTVRSFRVGRSSYLIAMGFCSSTFV